MAELAIEKLKQRHIEGFLEAVRDLRRSKISVTPEQLSASMTDFAVALMKAKVEGGEFAHALAEYRRGLLEIEKRASDLTVPEEDGVRVRAAARCEWFSDFDEDDVDDMEPWRVDELSSQITEAFNAAMEMPKN